MTDETTPPLGPVERQVRPLADAECDYFRRLPLSFNDMLRAVETAGWNACHAHMKAALVESDLENDRLREALTEANEETKLYPGHSGRWGKLLGEA